MPVIDITRADDPRIDTYVGLRERDLVGRDGLFVAEGKVVVEKLIGSGLHQPLSLLIAAKRVDTLGDMLARLPPGVPVFVAPQNVLDAIAGFPLHRGILAIGRRAEAPTPDDLLAGCHGPATVLLLSGIANHDNIGGIFRNAAAFGVRAVLLDADCCDPLYRKATRVSVGATLLVPFARLARGEDAIATVTHHGFEAIALSPAGPTPLTAWVPGARTAVLLGAEGPGLAPELIDRAQGVRIAMVGGFDSLNVATTSGIVLHHLVAARGRDG